MPELAALPSPFASSSRALSTGSLGDEESQGSETRSADVLLAQDSRSFSLRPMGAPLAQALAAAGSAVAGFSASAELTYRGDPYHYRQVAIAGGTISLLGSAAATQLGARLGQSRTALANVLGTTILTAATAALLQAGLDAATAPQGASGALTQQIMGGVGLAICLVQELATLGRLAQLGQQRWGAFPVGLPQRRALALFGSLTAAMAIAGVATGLAGRAQGAEAQRTGGFVLAGLGAIPAILALMAGTHPADPQG